MVFLAIIASLFAATGGGPDLVLLFSGLGGLSGLAAIATVFVTHRRNNQSAASEDKSVAIIELEKAVPGMGVIIQNWTDLVESQHAVIAELRQEVANLKTEIATLKSDRTAASVERTDHWERKTVE